MNLICNKCGTPYDTMGVVYCGVIPHPCRQCGSNNFGIAGLPSTHYEFLKQQSHDALRAAWQAEDVARQKQHIYRQQEAAVVWSLASGGIADGRMGPKKHDVGDYNLMGVMVPLSSYASGDYVVYGGATYRPTTCNYDRLYLHTPKNSYHLASGFHEAQITSLHSGCPVFYRS